MDAPAHSMVHSRIGRDLVVPGVDGQCGMAMAAAYDRHRSFRFSAERPLAHPTRICSVRLLDVSNNGRWLTGTAVQRLTEQGIELFGGMGIVQGMPIEKYVRDAIIQKHISFPFPTRFKLAESLAGFKRKVPPFIGAN